MIMRNQRSGARLIIIVVALTTILSCRDKGPKLTVGLPKENSHFVKGDTIHFTADLNSNEDPGVIPSDAWHWVSDIDGDLGRRPRRDTPNRARVSIRSP